MKIYITDLEAYTNQYLVGSWYQLPMNGDLLAEAIENELQRGKEVCKSEHYHEEYFITDYECEYMEIKEYSDINKLNEIAEAMEGIEEDGIKAILFLMENNFVKDIFEAIENYEDDVIIYKDLSMEDIAYDLIQESYDFDTIPTIISNNIDYQAIARDMEMEGSYYKVNNDIYEYIG